VIVLMGESGEADAAHVPDPVKFCNGIGLVLFVTGAGNVNVIVIRHVPLALPARAGKGPSSAAHASAIATAERRLISTSLESRF
jgi:hypothetical protein